MSAKQLRLNPQSESTLPPIGGAPPPRQPEGSRVADSPFLCDRCWRRHHTTRLLTLVIRPDSTDNVFCPVCNYDESRDGGYL